MKDNQKSRIFGLLGLARKAGKIAGGQFQTENAVKSGKAALVILAEDASGNTKKHFQDMCGFRDIPFITLGDKEELGACIGLEMRSVIAVTDASFAEAVLKILY